MLTDEQKKYANELIDKYSYQWEQARIQLLPPGEQVPCDSAPEDAKPAQSATADDDVDKQLKDETSDAGQDTIVDKGFEIDEIVSRYNQEWQSRQQVVTAGGNQ